jgi:hypothetical protein
LRAWSLNYVVEGSFRLPGARAAAAIEVDCVQELWFDSPTDAAAAFGSAGYRDRLRPLAQRLFSAQRQSSFLAEELVFFDEKPLHPKT